MELVLLEDNSEDTALAIAHPTRFPDRPDYEPIYTIKSETRFIPGHGTQRLSRVYRIRTIVKTIADISPSSSLSSVLSAPFSMLSESSTLTVSSASERTVVGGQMDSSGYLEIGTIVHPLLPIATWFEETTLDTDTPVEIQVSAKSGDDLTPQKDLGLLHKLKPKTFTASDRQKYFWKYNEKRSSTGKEIGLKGRLQYFVSFPSMIQSFTCNSDTLFLSFTRRKAPESETY